MVGAGATGGYVGAQLVAAGRDVTFLVHDRTRARLNSSGLRVRGGDGISTTRVNAVTVQGLQGPYDVVILGVRSDVVGQAINDIAGAVGLRTRIVPLMNGMAHVPLLTAAFGDDVVLGAVARLATSQLPDGTIQELIPGVQLEIGQLDGGRTEALARVVAELSVENVAVSVAADVLMAMWEKFAFITATAVLTCLAGDVIGPIARTAGGPALARRVLIEVASVAAAEGYPLPGPVLAGLDSTLTDPGSMFAPSMFRDLSAGRPVETTVLLDLAVRARRHGIDTPLLDAALVVIDVQTQKYGGRDDSPQHRWGHPSARPTEV